MSAEPTCPPLSGSTHDWWRNAGTLLIASDPEAGEKLAPNSAAWFLLERET